MLGRGRELSALAPQLTQKRFCLICNGILSKVSLRWQQYNAQSRSFRLLEVKTVLGLLRLWCFDLLSA